MEFLKLTMMGQFFEIPNESTGVFTPKATVEISILCLFQRLQECSSKARICLKIQKKQIFMGLAMVKFVFLCEKHVVSCPHDFTCNLGLLLTWTGFSSCFYPKKLLFFKLYNKSY